MFKTWLKYKQSAEVPPILTYAGLKCRAKLIKFSSKIGSFFIFLSWEESMPNDRKFGEVVCKRDCRGFKNKKCRCILGNGRVKFHIEKIIKTMQMHTIERLNVEYVRKSKKYTNNHNINLILYFTFNNLTLIYIFFSPFSIQNFQNNESILF